MTVSLCMIVKDEEAVLGRCLDSVAGCYDELIVVDTGSQDTTREVAGRYTPHVFEFTWREDFAAARNYAFSLGTGDFLFWLDADDILTPENREGFLRLKETLTSETDVVMMPYETAFDEDGKATFSFYRERMIRRTLPHIWKGVVHEALCYQGTPTYSRVAVRHQSVKTTYSDRNLRIYEKLMNSGEPFSPRDLFYYGRELFYHGRNSEATRILEAFLSLPGGWVENQIDACRLLGELAKRQGNTGGAMEAYCRSFLYDVPRGETSYEIGQLLLEAGNYPAAIYWFLRAIQYEVPEGDLGFHDYDKLRYAPYLGLCVCYDRMGDRERAMYYNQKAGELRPHSPAYQYNASYFQGESSLSEKETDA